MSGKQDYIAFQDGRRLARGSLAEVAVSVAQAAGSTGSANQQVLVFDAQSSRPADLDLRGTEAEIRQRYVSSKSPGTEQKQPRGRGRPRLGVVGKEVTLLPRHWEWLGRQPGGASVALRKLIDKARKEADPRDSIRAAQDASYSFMHAVAGDLPGFEEASRALYAGEQSRFEEETASWPTDLLSHLRELSREAFTGAG